MSHVICRGLTFLTIGMLLLSAGCRVEVADKEKPSNKKRKTVAKAKVTESEPTSFKIKDNGSDSSHPSNDTVMANRKHSDKSDSPASRDWTKNTPPKRDMDSGSDFSSSTPNRGMGSSAATQKVAGVVMETVELGPTLVIWALDISDSAFSLSRSVGSEIRGLYDKLEAQTPPKAKNHLLTALVTASHEVEFPIEEPTGSKTDIAAAFDKLKSDKTDKEVTFAAVKAAVDKYLPYRTQKQYQMMVVIVTDEAGDDGELVDALIPTLDKYAIPVFAIGSPAPFGKVTAAPSYDPGSFMSKKKGEAPVTGKSHQGPESRYIEFVDIPSLANTMDGSAIESGFGPFHLEFLCRGSGGAFLSMGSSSWGGSTRGMNSVDSSVMSKYAPDYTSEAEYQAQLEKNAAKMALHKAGKMPRVEKMGSVNMSFFKKNEVQFGKDVTSAQHIPAKIMPAIEELYQVLIKGEKDRDKLTSPRWQAAFDLAMGEASLLKANVEGYNEMLAQVKRKSGFKNESSTTWVLTPADTIEVQSTLEKLSKKGRMYLERVVKEHPKTPWAKLAERDLTAKPGWTWEER